VLEQMVRNGFITEAEGRGRSGVAIVNGVFAKRLEDGKLANFDAFLADIPADFSLYVASSWKGLAFRFDNAEYTAPSPQWADDAKKIPVVDAKGKQVYKDEAKERVFPVEYLGRTGSPVSNGSVATLDIASLGLPDDLIAAATNAVVTGKDLSAALIAAGGMSHQAVVDILSDASKTEAFKKALVA
jgi:hypothetical protein